MLYAWKTKTKEPGIMRPGPILNGYAAAMCSMAREACYLVKKMEPL